MFQKLTTKTLSLSPEPFDFPKHVGGGLVSKSGVMLKSFGVAGNDQKFVGADAKILRDTVVVSSPQVQAPVAVRYASANNSEASLYNKAGLPASPFRTDAWELPTPKNHKEYVERNPLRANHCEQAEN